MVEVCKVCGLPKDLCVCGEIKRESTQRIRVYTEHAKFRKFVTIIEGVDKSQLQEVLKTLKRKLACGGSIKEDKIILQGDHKRKILPILKSLGFREEVIEID